MDVKIALAGNPNSGKTTMFNHLTGSNQYVGNWPGVTVEKKEGRLKADGSVLLQDLPGIYSLSPYTTEEVVTRDYLLGERPDAIINIVDGSNLERNLYLTTQLLELGIPVVIAINMMDIVRKRGDTLDLSGLGAELGCPIIETAASKGEGASEVAEAAAKAARAGAAPAQKHVLGGALEHALAHIEEIIGGSAPQKSLRWYSVKLFERDERVMRELKLPAATQAAVEKAVKDCERELGDDCESIVTNARYNYIEGLMAKYIVKADTGGLTASDKIDNIVTSRVLALPIFAAVMFLTYFLALTVVGKAVGDFTVETVFGTWIEGGAARLMEAMNVAPLIQGLVLRGIIGGVGAVLSFVPQILALFFFLAILEECGYMSRIAFILDKLFRKFGLSGKSFIPMLIGTGCGVPGIMASRTIESEQDRRMTIITTTFMPCGAKMPIIALMAGAVFGGAWWAAPCAYFIGIASVIVTGVMLKKTRLFSGEPSPFVLELPAYHMPRAKSVLRSMWDRGWSFIKKAGTIILLASIAVWFLSGFGFTNGRFGPVDGMEASVLAFIGGGMAFIFEPLGFGQWQAAVATIMGFIAKEEIVGVFGVLYHVSGDALELAKAGAFDAIAASFTPISAASFVIFNLLCMPCVAAVGAIRREMNSARWTLFAIAYQMCYAYAVSLIVFQLGSFFSGGGFKVGTAAALAVLTALVYMLVRPKSAAQAPQRR